jgi:hypothetical protein
VWYTDRVAIYAETDRTLVVGDRRWPLAHYHTNDFTGPGAELAGAVVPAHTFRIRRAVVAFENGWSLSIIWGTGTYSDNHDAWWMVAEDDFTETPERVETMVLFKDEAAMADPYGYLDADQLHELLSLMMGWPSDPAALVQVLKAMREDHHE